MCASLLLGVLRCCPLLKRLTLRGSQLTIPVNITLIRWAWRSTCAALHRARTLCEAPSLTAHGCLEPDHDSSKEHSSGVRYVSACNCGRTKCARDDPYTARQANHAFYVAAAAECGVCDTLPAIDFPVFQPSTPTYRAATVKGAPSQEAEAPERQSGSGGSASGAGAGGSWSAPDALSPPSDDDDREPDRYVLHVRADTTHDKVMTRQPSTTEYLPGMLHTGSPAGLLPACPSWSLLCIGASSLYSHSAGLPEHLQPGFLPHTNFLLPWDCAVRMDQVSMWRAARGRGKQLTPHHLTVKIFIGIEYECPRGHRFMMSSPDTVVSGGGGGCTREAGAAGAKLAATDMPLYATCLCRSATTMLAQLMRVHVVTPKAPVHVTLDPKVQPMAGGPVFTPQPAGSAPVKLSPSAYWVLRLPRVYADERGVLPRHRGTLLAPLFGLQE